MSFEFRDVMNRAINWMAVPSVFLPLLTHETQFHSDSVITLLYNGIPNEFKKKIKPLVKDTILF